MSSWRDAFAGDFAVIGDPVSHSLSPAMHQAAYDALGLTYRYVAVHVPRGEVTPALDHLRSLGYRGVNVTVPHKEEVLDWCETVDPFALRVRAANTLKLSDRSCINTDAPGFLDTLRPLRLTDHTALVLGAGGASRALCLALAEAGWSLAIYNRTFERAEDLALVVGASAVEIPDPTGAALILNTTSASLGGEELPIDWSLAEPGAVAYDLMYSASSTPFLQAAAAHGLSTVDGRELLVAQGALSFEWWLGIEAPRKAMRAAL